MLSRKTGVKVSGRVISIWHVACPRDDLAVVTEQKRDIIFSDTRLVFTPSVRVLRLLIDKQLHVR